MSNLQPDEALYSLLCKYLLNEADATERQWVEAWRMQQPVNEEVLNAVSRVLEASMQAAAHPARDTEASWQRLLKDIGRGQAKERPESPDGSRPQPEAAIIPMQGREPEASAEAAVIPMRRRFTWPAAAAILVIALGLGYWLWPGPAAEPQVFAGGQQAVLEDGSRVALEQNAALKVAESFGKKERRVQFSGKAVFNVAQNPGNPFVVELGQTEIKVLGTEFSVDYDGHAELTIHVSSGKILVTDRQQGDSVVLTQGMMLRREEQKAHFSVAENIPDLSGKQLVFHNVPLHKVLAAVEAVYNIQVSVADSTLLQKEVTANFENESVDNVMATIAYMTNSQAEKTGEQQFSIK
ncbi:FecR domain-containing protein [Chitinophaga sp.]|uniref:FecR family protein n=1 Tax=Chitinophaga sp. TaxID=1869181 RepID=UPI0031CF1F7B